MHSFVQHPAFGYSFCVFICYELENSFFNDFANVLVRIDIVRQNEERGPRTSSPCLKKNQNVVGSAISSSQLTRNQHYCLLYTQEMKEYFEPNENSGHICTEAKGRDDPGYTAVTQVILIASFDSSVTKLGNILTKVYRPFCWWNTELQ